VGIGQSYEPGALFVALAGVRVDHIVVVDVEAVVLRGDGVQASVLFGGHGAIGARSLGTHFRGQPRVVICTLAARIRRGNRLASLG
jgi:hypothetical protein